MSFNERTECLVKRYKKRLRICSFVLAVTMTLCAFTGCGTDKENTDKDNLGVDIVTDDWGGNVSVGSTTEAVISESTESITNIETETQSITETSTIKQTDIESESENTITTTSAVTTKETTKAAETTSAVLSSVTTVPTSETTVTTKPSVNVKPSGFTGELQDFGTTLNVITSESKAYWYNQLTEKEENAYNKLLSAVLKYRGTVSFDTTLTNEEYNRVFVLLYNQNPELFWLSGKTVLASDGKSATLFYVYDKETTAAMQVKLDKRVKELLDMLSADMTTLEKLLVCHNYIVKYNTYSNETKNSTNAYGCIIEGKSQCSGYAKGMQYMCDQLKIPCIYVNGVSAETGNTHAWNQIYIDDGWYNVDVMWDDPYMEPEDKKNVSYRYMGVPDLEIMGITHLDANMPATKDYTYFKLPSCTATLNNADVQYGEYADTYEEIYEKLKRGALDAVKNGRYCAHVKVKSRAVYEDALDRLLTQKEVYNIRDVINAEYGAGYVVGFAAAPENAMNYIEITLKYGEGNEPR